MISCETILVPPVSLEINWVDKAGQILEQNEMVKWLDSLAPWKVFFTGSPDFMATKDCLQRCYESFMKKYYPDVSYVYSIEPYVARGWVVQGKFYPAFHMHAMFDDGHDIRWKEFWGRWFERYGRARTEPIVHKADVQSYVTKYVMKGHADKTNNSRREIWWNVKLSKYRKHMRKQAQEGVLIA